VIRSPDLRPLRVRLRATNALLLAALACLALRAAQLALTGERGERRGESQLLTALALPPERGRVLDRDGTELALTVDVPSVYAVPAAIESAPAASARLARALGLEPAAVRERLAQRRPFVFLGRWVDDEIAERVRALDLPGIGIVEEPKRAYPHGALAASAVGFANIDGQGVRGLEEQENEWLVGQPGRVQVERDARGRLLIGPGIDPNASAGGDVALTLDVTLQAEAEQALAEGVEEAGARGGFVVSLDPRTGELLTLAERPTFDPNNFRAVAYPDTRSRVFTDVAEPGSTFKTFVIAAALEAGVIRPTDVFDLRGGLQVPGKRIRDLHPHPALDVAGILRVSSNVGAAKIEQRVGPRLHHETLRRFGFGAVTGSGFPDEAGGLLRSWKAWRPVDAATAAFGQGVSVTPIQLAAAMGALGNDGVWVRPHLVRARRRAAGEWRLEPIGESRRAVSAATAAQLREMLEGVVAGEGGTAHRAQLVGVRVAGKTGTAQKLDANGRYSSSRYLAWFVGLAPADAPRIAIAVGIDEPTVKLHTGGAVAAPVFARVAAAHLSRLGIPTMPVVAPPAEPATRVAAAERPGSLALQGDRVLVPDLRGLTVAEVVQRTQGTAIELELQGQGRAVAQDPVPGSVLSAGRERLRVRFKSDPGGAPSGNRSASPGGRG
jgi:cell division protein FtsI (penicillin-binding protein 3)